jgi:hypothetical protein
MQRLSVWARWIAVGFFTLIVIPLLVEFLKHLAENIGLYDRPREAAGAVLNFFLSLAELPWLRVTALVLGGFVAGLWLDWLLRQLDRSRAEARKNLIRPPYPLRQWLSFDSLSRAASLAYPRPRITDEV